MPCQTAWSPASIDHNKTKFPVTGAHVTVACAQCHTKGYTGTSTVCVDCHWAKFNATTNPNHKTLGISTDCKLCHTTNLGWQPATFASHNTYYVITGAHTSIKDCNTCHKGIYNGSTHLRLVLDVIRLIIMRRPIKSQSRKLSTTCEQCHSQTAWSPASIDHNKTKFPLTEHT